MTGLFGSRGNGIVALLTLLALRGACLVARHSRDPHRAQSPVRRLSRAVRRGGTCPPRGDALENGRRSEELARLRTDRYAYDPRDGVRAVRRYQEAESCYRAAGDELGAHRVRRASAALTARVNTDYAAARLNL